MRQPPDAVAFHDGPARPVDHREVLVAEQFPIRRAMRMSFGVAVNTAERVPTQDGLRQRIRRGGCGRRPVSRQAHGRWWSTACMVAEQPESAVMGYIVTGGGRVPRTRVDEDSGQPEALLAWCFLSNSSAKACATVSCLSRAMSVGVPWLPRRPMSGVMSPVSPRDAASSARMSSRMLAERLKPRSCARRLATARSDGSNGTLVGCVMG